MRLINFPNINLLVNNPNYGYTTTIQMPFNVVSLGNNKIMSYDNGEIYDRYTCNVSIVLDNQHDYQELYNALCVNGSLRGENVKLSECNSTGFYPFGCHVSEPVGGYTVVVSKVVFRDKVDDVGKFWKIDLMFTWLHNKGSEVVYNSPVAFGQDGSLTIGTVSGLPFPGNGFDIDNSYSVNVNQNYGGVAYVTALDYLTGDNNKERINSSFSLALSNNQLNNLLIDIITDYRSSNTPISTPEIYFPFGAGVSTFSNFMFKLTSGKIEIKHRIHNIFDLKLDIEIQS